MSIKLTIDGISIEVSTPAEAMELIRLHKTGEASYEAQSKARENGQLHIFEPPRQDPPPPLPAADPQVLRWTVNFLRTVGEAGMAGTSTDRIVSALNVNHPKAVGGRMAVINKLLEEHGFRVREIYSNKKTPTGRVWKSRKSLPAALAATEKLSAVN